VHSTYNVRLVSDKFLILFCKLKEFMKGRKFFDYEDAIRVANGKLEV